MKEKIVVEEVKEEANDHYALRAQRIFDRLSDKWKIAKKSSETKKEEKK